jgi:hypothetical protein
MSAIINKNPAPCQQQKKLATSLRIHRSWSSYEYTLDSSSSKVSELAVTSAYGMGSRAATIPTTATFTSPGVSQDSFQEVAFRNRAEAKILGSASHWMFAGN